MYKRTTFEDESARKRIKGRVLVTLEFDKIRQRLEECSRSVYGRELCVEITPTSDYDEVNEELKETYETFTYISKYGFLPLGGFPDLRPALKYAHAGGTLSMRQLLDTASFLRSVERLKAVMPDAASDMDGTVLFERIGGLVEVSSLEKDISSSIT